MTEKAGTCSTCQHWQRQGETWSFMFRLTLAEGETADDRHTFSSAHQDRVARAERRFGWCGAITRLDSYDELDEDNLPMAFAKDGSDYKADVYSREDFTCALWAGEGGV